MNKIMEYLHRPEARHRLMNHITIFCVVGGVIYTIIFAVAIAMR